MRSRTSWRSSRGSPNGRRGSAIPPRPASWSTKPSASLAMAGGAEILALAERLQAPVVTYTGGKGVVSDRHYLAQNLLAGHDLWKTADVVLAIGTRLNQPQTRWGFDAGIKLIRVDLDPVEITRIVRPAIGIVADAKDTAAALLRAVDGGPKRSSRQAELT